MLFDLIVNFYISHKQLIQLSHEGKKHNAMMMRVMSHDEKSMVFCLVA